MLRYYFKDSSYAHLKKSDYVLLIISMTLIFQSHSRRYYDFSFVNDRSYPGNVIQYLLMKTVNTQTI